MSTCWITLNRACNLRCAWCYSKKDDYRFSANMKEKTLDKIFEICNEGKVSRVILIGGEPTISPLFSKALKLADLYNIKTSIVTNGLTFSDLELVNYIANSPSVSGVNVSIKCYGDDNYLKATGSAAYTKTLDSIKNLIENGVKVTPSIVLTKDNIANLTNILNDLLVTKVEQVVLSFCRYFNVDENENRVFLEENNPFEMIKLFEEKFNEIEQSELPLKIYLQSGYPLCIFPKDFLAKLENSGVLRHLCQLLRRTGFIFDTDGSLMPCNYMYDISLGKLDVDFNNYEELSNCLKSKENTKIFNKLIGLPSKKCIDCEMLPRCGGGCVLNWTNFTYDQLFDDLKQ